MEQFYYFGQIVLAMILGSALGLQRERSGKPAGPRTYAMVAVGATLFTILSLNAFGAATAYVAAQIVTGVGFLCAGIILHKEDKVHGLTTAAGLWTAAAVGMAVGARYLGLSVAVTLLMLLLFMIDDSWFRKK